MTVAISSIKNIYFQYHNVIIVVMLCGILCLTNTSITDAEYNNGVITYS